MFPQSAYSGPEIFATAPEIADGSCPRRRLVLANFFRGGKTTTAIRSRCWPNNVIAYTAGKQWARCIKTTTAARRAEEITGVSIRKENFILLLCERLYRVRSIIIFSLARNWGNNGVRARINNTQTDSIHHGNFWRFLLRFCYIRRVQSILTRSHPEILVSRTLI